mgnify:CR=1 FL=1
MWLTGVRDSRRPSRNTTNMSHINFLTAVRAPDMPTTRLEKIAAMTAHIVALVSALVGLVIVL